MSLDIHNILPGVALPKGGAGEVGNKALNLMRMASAGLPVPPAFVLPATWYARLKSDNSEDLKRTVVAGIKTLESVTELGFGSQTRPLLVSMRSGGAVSMPGMLETVLNIGLNARTVEGLIGYFGNPRLAWDCYRRLIQAYAGVVERLPREPFDELVSAALNAARVEAEHHLDFAALRQLVQDMLERFRELAGTPFPEDPYEQLHRSAVEVFRSWDAPKAVAYRQANCIAHDSGTSVTVQQMVFGNAGALSGSGVAFTRDPATGASDLYIDFAFNVQGEDIVSGRLRGHGTERLRRTLPVVWNELQRSAQTLEALFRDAQDFEFTVQDRVLYLLQSRSAKRTPWAELRIAVDQVREGLITHEEGLARLSQYDLGSIVRQRLVPTDTSPLAHAEVAGMGIACGAIVLDSERAIETASSVPVILVRREADTEDIKGLVCARGLLTAVGGRTSHAAVVARQLGKVCLTACADLQIDLKARSCRIGDTLLYEGDIISLDGNDGTIYSGKVEVITERPEAELRVIDTWRAEMAATAPA